MRKVRFPVLIILVLVILSSCSYGFFNFSSEVGDLDIYFEIKGDNALSVDSLVYTMTSPNGDSVDFKDKIDYYNTSLHIEKMLSGTWEIVLYMKSGKTTVQTYSTSVDIVTGKQTRVEFRANYVGPDYNIVCYTPNSDSENEQVFKVTDFQVYPEMFYQADADQIIGGYTAWISGSSFLSEIEEITLRQPDYGIYIFGYDYNRALLFSHLIEDDLITVKNRMVDSPADMDGAYILYMTDHAGNMVRQELDVDMGDYESMIPGITSEIPDSIDSSSNNTFQWEIADSSNAGTILLFIVNSSSGSVYPSDNTIAVTGTSGTLSVPAGMLSPGANELIIAAIGYSTATPVDDATAIGLTSPDLRSESFVETMQAIYGKSTGRIMFYSAYFNVN